MSVLSASSRSPVDKARRQAAPWVEVFARCGYAAKGVTYLLVGVFATMAAFGVGGSTDGSKGMLRSLATGTFGTTLVAAIGIGLIGYALWMFVRAILDPEKIGDDKTDIAQRIFIGIGGLIYASLAFVALQAAFAGGGGSDSGDTQGKVATVLDWPGGMFLIGAIGLGIIGYGIYQFVKAYKSDLSDELDTHGMAESVRKAAFATGRAGFVGRGVAFTMIGFFFLTAAWQSDSSEAGGLGEALKALGAFGNIALGATAIGLAAYGIYMLIMARYRRINAK